MKFRKKPVEVEAVRWDGTAKSYAECACLNMLLVNESRLLIRTPEGAVTASVGDWIIRGVKGELYPCKPDVFEATYEPLESKTE